MSNLDEFIMQSTQRLNIQASLANRTGYFYIVNQSTGLVLQAVDFTSEFSSLREQIETNQKRIQSSSLKATSTGIRSGGVPASKSPSNVSKGPRFFLMPKVSHQPVVYMRDGSIFGNKHFKLNLQSLQQQKS